MAKRNDKAPGSALSMDDLDKVVGGAALAPTTTKKPNQTDALDAANQGSGLQALDAPMMKSSAAPAFLTGGAITLQTGGGMPASMAVDYAMAQELAKPNTVVDNAVRGTAKALMSQLGVPAAQAESIAWAAAFEVVRSGRAAPGMADMAMNSIRGHADDVYKGLAAKVAYGGDLKSSLSTASSFMADAIGKAPASKDAIMAKGQSMFESGLDSLKNTEKGKLLMAALNNPDKADAWGRLAAETAIAKNTPTPVTAVKFMTDVMASDAMAKAMSAGHIPASAEIRQTAAALSRSLDTVQAAMVEISSSGWSERLSFGLGFKGAIDIAVNCGALGKAMWSGDTAAMGKAAQALVTDAFNDMKDGMKRAYVDSAGKAFDATKAVTMQMLDGLGATPYAKVAVEETKKAMTDFGNMAKGGSTAAVNAMADFAKRDILGAGAVAVDEIKGVARAAGAAGETAVNALSDVARSGAKQAEGAVYALVDVGRSGSKYATAAVNTLGDVAKSGAGQALVATYALIDLSRAPAAYASQAISVLDTVGKSGVKQAGVAIEGLADVAKSGAKHAESAVYALIDVSRYGAAYANQAMDRLGSVANSAAAQAELAASGLIDLSRSTSAYAQYAMHSLADVAKSGLGQAAFAVEGLTSVARSGATYANHAIDTLGDVAKSGVGYANQAVDALKGLSGEFRHAGEVLEDAGNKVGGYAKTAWNETSSFFRSAWPF